MVPIHLSCFLFDKDYDQIFNGVRRVCVEDKEIQFVYESDNEYIVAFAHIRVNIFTPRPFLDRICSAKKSSNELKDKKKMTADYRVPFRNSNNFHRKGLIEQ